MNAHAPLPVGDCEIPASDLPFLAPPDRIISVDLPPPVSVNRSRKVDWRAMRKVKEWICRADAMVMARGGVRRLGQKLPGMFEAKITIDENQCGGDLDNLIKGAIDYCRRLNLVVDDSPKYMRRVVIEFGDADTGMRVTLREVG